MLTIRPMSRTGKEHLALDRRVEIFDGEAEIGRLIVDPPKHKGELTLGGATYPIAHKPGLGLGESPLEMMARALTKKPKPNPDQYELTDATGRLVAAAEMSKEVFTVTCEAGRFRFAKGETFLIYRLTPEGADAPLGWVGQRKRFTKSLEIDLPETISRPVQGFLLALYILIGVQRASHYSSN